MIVYKRVVSLFIVLFIGLSLTFISNTYAGDNQRSNRSKQRSYKHLKMDAITGEVQEKILDDDMMFLRIKSGHGNKWVAVPQGKVRKVKVGDQVSLKPGVIFTDYHIKGLKRNFPRVVFSDGPVE